MHECISSPAIKAGLREIRLLRNHFPASPPAACARPVAAGRHGGPRGARPARARAAAVVGAMFAGPPLRCSRGGNGGTGEPGASYASSAGPPARPSVGPVAALRPAAGRPMRARPGAGAAPRACPARRSIAGLPLFAPPSMCFLKNAPGRCVVHSSAGLGPWFWAGAAAPGAVCPPPLRARARARRGACVAGVAARRPRARAALLASACPWRPLQASAASGGGGGRPPAPRRPCGRLRARLARFRARGRPAGRLSSRNRLHRAQKRGTGPSSPPPSKEVPTAFRWSAYGCPAIRARSTGDPRPVNRRSAADRPRIPVRLCAPAPRHHPR